MTGVQTCALPICFPVTIPEACFKGVINRIPFKTGSLVSEGDLLTSISNNQEVFAYFNVSEKEFLDIVKRNSMGGYEEVSFLMANNELFPFPGLIETAENEIDKGTGNIAFRARFKNPRYVLRHGATGKVLVKEELKNALIIPQKRTFEIQDKTFVFVVDKDNMVQTRAFKPGRRVAQYYIVEAGLKPGERIVYEGVQSIRQGAKIKPVKMNLDSLMQTALTIN